MYIMQSYLFPNSRQVSTNLVFARGRPIYRSAVNHKGWQVVYNFISTLKKIANSGGCWLKTCALPTRVKDVIRILQRLFYFGWLKISVKLFRQNKACERQNGALIIVSLCALEQWLDTSRAFVWENKRVFVLGLWCERTENETVIVLCVRHRLWGYRDVINNTKRRQQNSQEFNNTVNTTIVFFL